MMSQREEARKVFSLTDYALTHSLCDTDGGNLDIDLSPHSGLS